ncbi:MAG TPA: alpha/beta hydrolase [Rhizomicrobium sp.]|nr:alpha/beta hydrolase [Rhizomicrobium sp.]
MRFVKNMGMALALATGATLMLTGCMSPPLINLLVSNEGYSIKRDIAYGTKPREMLDIYVPDKITKPASTILFFYGGSWQSGTKDLYKAFGETFATKGIITVVADYRLYPPALYPDFVNDGAQALKFVHDHIAQYGGDPNRVFLAGHSAGAYIAVMLAANPAIVRANGAKPEWIRGAIGISGPYDFLPLKDKKLITIFGGNDRIETQPIHYVDGKRAPMFFAWGADDTTVGKRNLVNMAAKLREFGSPVETKIYPGVTHIGIIVSLAPFFRSRTTLRQDMIEFIKTH